MLPMVKIFVKFLIFKISDNHDPSKSQHATL